MPSMSGGGGSKYWARLSMGAVQAIANTTQTKLSFSTAIKSDAWPTIALPVTSLVIPVTGLYLIMPFDMDWGDASGGAGSRRLGMRIGDVAGTIRQGTISAPTLAAAAIQTVFSWGRIRPLTADNTIEFYAFQSSGGSLNAALNDVGVFLLDQMASNPLASTDS